MKNNDSLIFIVLFLLCILIILFIVLSFNAG